MKPVSILIACTFLMFACKKPEQAAEPVKKTNREYLLAGKWLLVNVEEKRKEAGGVTTNDITSQTSPCVIDDQFVYTSSGKQVAYRLGIKCNPDENSTDTTSSWELLDNESQIKIGFYDNQSQFITVSYDISELSESRMVFMRDMNYSEQDGRLRTYTYKNVN